MIAYKKERIFFVCGLLMYGRHSEMKQSLERCVYQKLKSMMLIGSAVCDNISL